MLTVALAVTWSVLALGRAPMTTVRGDEGTFLAMMQSLVVDGDLRFDERDATRAVSAEGGRGHLILQRVGGEDSSTFAYSKPVVFPLLAAPFYAVAGELGPVVLNLSVLVLALWLARGYLRSLAARYGDSAGLADLALVGFAGPAVVVPNAFWRMADSLQFSIALLGLVLVVGSRRIGSAGGEGMAERVLAWRGAPWLGTVLLAVLVSMRISNGLLALVPVGLALADSGWRTGWRRALARLAVVGASLFLLHVLTAELTGAANPYRAQRSTFTPQTGYPAGNEAEEVLSRFDRNRASHFTRIDRPAISTQVLYSALYVWMGRHTGLFVYYPASLLLLWLAVRRSDAAGRWILIAFLGTVAFYVGWKPGNYFGGETFLGNRYLLPAYAALLVAVRRLPTARSWIPIWILAALALSSAGISVRRCAELEGRSGVGPCRSSQNHAYAGLFRWLPWESTSRRIGGVRDRYWAGELVRFVDPWVDVGDRSFYLTSGRPTTEISVAHWQQARIQRLRVRSTADVATLVVDHGGDRRRVEVGRSATQPASSGRAWSTIDLEPKRLWRRHRFWFNDTEYWVGTYRFSLESEQPEARAEIVFLGDPVAASRAIAYELLDDTWPEKPLQLTLRNASPLPWERDDPVRVTLRWSLLGLNEEGAAARRLADSEPLQLPHDVRAGQTVELEVPVAWPTDPGTYVVEVDLVLEHVAWFSEVLGSPLLRKTFEVPGASPDPQPRDGPG